MARLDLSYVWVTALTTGLVGCGGGGAGTTEGSTGPGITSVAPSSTGADSEATAIPTGDVPTSSTGTGGSMSDTQGDSSGTDSTTMSVDPTLTTGTGPGTDTLTEDCPAGDIVCEGDTAKVCDGMGGYTEETPCPGGCQPMVGCLLCEPGTTLCDGNVSMKCSDDGLSVSVNEACDELQGMTCNPDVGLCDGVCALENLQLSYIGCDYYPTITLQHDGYNGGTKVFAAVIANTTGVAANITITRGAMMIEELVVPAGEVKEVPLKWVPELTKGLGPSKLTVDGAYRLRSDHPVTVYQYNLLYADASNDASLLLPVNAWTGDYVVASYPHAASNDYPGFYAVVARQDDTKVTLTPSSTGGKVQAGGGVAADGTGEVVLMADDVLQVATAPGGDLTGTIIHSDRPVQVIAGHKCSKVPQDVDLCDHLEEAMFPVEALALEYIVIPPVQSPNDQADQGQVVRIVASEADTKLTFTPPQAGVPTTIAAAGDFVEIVDTTAKFIVAADKKILVAQYMIGQGGGYGAQDPSMLLAVATEQYRKDYLFQAPNSWDANYVDIILKTGTSVTVDGIVLKNDVKLPIAGTAYSLAHILLNKDGTGSHTLTADDRVGISVYGIQDFGSYWVVGGLDLDHL
jgi:hypothetical protein